jgi:uncharacterized protein with HEPN domain
MPRSILLRLTDTRDAIRGIADLTAGVSYEAFVQNWGMQRAVERGLEIISEASRHVPDDYKALASDIPWRQIAGIGNLLRHEYQRTDSLLIWNIVSEHLPSLAEAVNRLIQTASTREEP